MDKPLSPSAEMVTFELEDGTVMTLRGSGTEPKLKYYIEANGESLEEAEGKAKVVEGSLLAVFRDMGLAL
jgi:phosphoglucomutase